MARFSRKFCLAGCSALFACGMLLAGCSGGRQPAAQSDTLIYGRAFDANTLDPINTDIGEAASVIENIYDTLITYDDETMELTPALAVDLGEMSKDGKTWTFKLREGVKFHNGEPFTSAAVKFTFDRLGQPKNEHVYDDARPYHPTFAVIDEVQTPDDFTVVFQLKQPHAAFQQCLAMFAASVVSPQAVRETKGRFGVQPVGTGPFKFKSWEPPRKIVLAAYDEHWRGRPKINNVVFLAVTETATRIQQMERGEIHIADNLPPHALDELDKRADVSLQEIRGTNVAYLTMQTEKPPLDHLKVRQAIAFAIDKNALLRVAYGSHAEPAVTMVPASMEEWHNDALQDRPHDIAQAKQLLQEAADELQFDLPLELSLAVMADARPYMQQPLQVATFIKDALAPIGIRVNVIPRGANEHFEYLMAGKHQLGLAGWSSDNFDPDNFLYTLLDEDNISESGNNMSRFRNAEMHELLLAAQQEMDKEKRREMYNRAQQIVFDEAPVVPLVHTVVRIAQRENVAGYKLHPSAMVRLRLAYLKEAP